MPYDGILLLLSFGLAVPILIGALPVFLILYRLRCVPRGVRSLPAYGLIVLAGYIGCYAATDFQVLVRTPAKLQVKYLGQVYGTPFALRGYDYSGFADPVSEWTYALDAAALADLKRRCLPGRPDPGRCYLFEASDERWDATVWIEQDMLHVEDGLH